MSFSYTPYAFPLIIAAIFSLALAFYAWSRRATSGARALAFMAGAIFIWEAAYSLEISGVTLETKYIWGTIQYIGITVSTYSWLIFSIIYSGYERVLTLRFRVLAALIPSATILLALTTKWHGLVWSAYRLESQGDFFGFDVTHGVWFWVHFAYSYLLLLAGAALLVRSLMTRKGLYRGQIFALLVALSAPWIGNALFFAGYSPIPYLDLTPFALTISVATLTWAIFGFHLTDLAPLARDYIVDSMREGMIVLDARGTIVDVNSAAARMIGVSAANAIGKMGGDVFSPWEHLVEQFRDVLDARDEISVGEGEAKRRYEVRLSPLQDPQGKFAGRVIMLRLLDDDAPQPSAPSHAASYTPIQSLPRMSDAEEDTAEKKAAPIWGALAGYFFVHTKKDISVPSGVNPVWYRTRERIFTIGARIVSSLGLIALAIAPHNSFSTPVVLVFGALLTILLGLGVARTIKYEIRVMAFLALVYGFALVETLNFGFSVESFIFFLSFVILAAVLTSRYGAVRAFALAVVSLSVFFILIYVGGFIPLLKRLDGVYVPEAGFSSLLVFIASASATNAFIVILLENLNTAWQKEEQASNLLRQERDLLEQRVEERTRDLAEARDQALTISRQMRKYFRAMQQSGNAIVITDAEGNVEYANPHFTEVTGYALEEVFGSNPRILKSGRQRPEFYEKLWNTITAGQVWHGVFHNRKKDGSLYWESSTIAPVLDEHGKVTNYVAVKEDVTARRQVEEQLRKLSQAVEQSGNTVIIMDKNGFVEYVNPKFTEVTGYSQADATGKSPIALMNGFGTEPDFSRDDWWLTVNDGRVWRGEFHNHRKGGALLWESATIAPVFNREGEIINFIEIKQDITEQKILQEQLQKQNDYLSILHQMTLDLLNRRSLDELLQVVVDRSAVLLDAPYAQLMLLDDGDLTVHATTVNAKKLLGARNPRRQGSATWQAVDSRQPVFVEDYSQWAQRREVYDGYGLRATAAFPILAGERCLGVLGLGRVNPGYVFSTEQIETGVLFARLVALVLDNANLYQSALSEISERKRAEALLQESEARFRQIIENASDIIYRANADGNFTYLNPAALKMMGYASEQEALGKNYFDFSTPDFRPQLMQMYKQQCAEKIRNAYYEIPSLAADGHIIWVGQNVQLIMEGGQVVGFQAVARNITEIKQAQEALALSRDQALDASRFKSQLLSRVSHELRTPLGGILGYAELLQFEAFGPLSENQQGAVNSIIESTNYLTEIVNDLLDEAQIESKSLTLHNEFFNPADLMEKTISPLKVLAEKKGLAMCVEVSASLPSELYGDVKRLQQILVNLVGNAIKFTSVGEIRIMVDRPAPAQWSMAVRDTGAGIPASERQNIFEPFRQVNNSISRENRGSGLGLAITKQLIELMGGRISLESQVGKGSLFVVTLPIINAPGE